MGEPSFTRVIVEGQHRRLQLLDKQFQVPAVLLNGAGPPAFIGFMPFDLSGFGAQRQQIDIKQAPGKGGPIPRGNRPQRIQLRDGRLVIGKNA